MGSVAAFAGEAGGARAHETVRRMLASAPHRGTQLDIRSLGHTTLGVSNAQRPGDASLAEDGTLLVALSGALDNAADLSAALDRAGVPPGPPGNAGVVLRAFRAWGEAAPARLRGPSAAAVTDGERLWCFRDHIGLAPLFWRHDGAGALCATEARQVVAGAGIPREPDLAAVGDLFFLNGLPERATVWRGVERVPRATVLAWRPGGGPTLRRYWDPAALVETAHLTAEEAREGLVARLAQAVERALTGSDAIMLSGGVDSPALAALAAPAHLARSGRPLLAVSSVYPDLPRVDERRYIELVAGHLGLALHAMAPTARPLDDLRAWAELLDGPAYAVHVPEVAEGLEAARRLGASNVLTGELAEYAIGSRRHLLGHLLLAGRPWAAWHHARWVRAAGAPWARIARSVAPSVTPRRLAAVYLHARPRPMPVPPWYRPAGVEPTVTRPDLSVPSRRRWIEQQLNPLRGTPVMLEGAEHCAARFGVTVRRPFADVDLWEFFLRLPAEVKFPDPTVPKALVREAFRGRLPDAIVDRRDKTYFDDWFLADPRYAALRGWLVDSPFRLPGIDYAILQERLERECCTLLELLKAYELASVHAFVSSC